ncbi:MAG: aromatic ring-hydroxylating dioxygenase subunit alpha [Acidimicrobiales bacterium]|nr:aromatic ring-hydroxylating dioxygenase subunit alpha [Acidimicrobiales bacterium]
MNAISTNLPFAIEELLPSRGNFTEAVGLPPSVYHNEQIYEFEMEAIFGQEWLCVGRSESLGEVGDFFSRSCGGEQIIVVRTSETEIRAMSAVCQHRGLCVTADIDRDDGDLFGTPVHISGNARQFRCPYHHWVYDIDGQLVGAPEMSQTAGFEKSSISLPKIPTEIWQGFVFVNLSNSPRPLAPSLAKLDAVLENHDLGGLITVDPITIPDVPFNWKIMIENFMEGYHNSRLHSGIHDFAPSSGIWYSPYEQSDGGMYGLNRTLETGGGFNPTNRALFPFLPNTTEAERQQVIFALLPPSLLIGVQSDSAFWFTVDPTGPKTHSLSMAYLFPEETTKLPLFDKLLESAIQGVSYFNAQDMPTNVGVQQGMESRFAPRGNYSWQEAVIPQFNSWLVERYSRAIRDLESGDRVGL